MALPSYSHLPLPFQCTDTVLVNALILTSGGKGHVIQPLASVMCRLHPLAFSVTTSFRPLLLLLTSGDKSRVIQPHRFSMCRVV